MTDEIHAGVHGMQTTASAPVGSRPAGDADGAQLAGRDEPVLARSDPGHGRVPTERAGNRLVIVTFSARGERRW